MGIHLISSSWCCRSISDVKARVTRRNLAQLKCQENPDDIVPLIQSLLVLQGLTNHVQSVQTARLIGCFRVHTKLVRRRYRPTNMAIDREERGVNVES